MSSKTEIVKGINGWEGETVFPAPQNEYTWKITTSKRSSGKIMSIATAWQYEDGSLIWDMLFAPKITLVSKKARATEKEIRSAHYEAVGKFEIMLEEGQVPEKEQPSSSDSDFNLNDLGLTGEGQGDSDIGDAWKDKVNSSEPKNEDVEIGEVDLDFIERNNAAVAGAVKQDPTLNSGYSYVIEVTKNFTDFSDYKNDQFVRNVVRTFLKNVEPFLKRTKPYLFKEEDKGYTGLRTEGRYYQQTKDLGVTEIAKLAREEFKALFPEMKWSVRIERYSGGQSINAIGTNYPNNPFTPEYIEAVRKTSKTQVIENNRNARTGWNKDAVYIEPYTEQFQRDSEKAKQVLAQYRYNDSDGMIDYFSTNFYDHTKIDIEDWEQRLFADDEEVKRSKEFWNRVEEDKKKGSEKAKKKLEENNILPNFTIVKWDTIWRSLGRKEVQAVIMKSPNGRSRYSFMSYDLTADAPKHPKPGYIFTRTVKGISITSVKLDEDAAKLPYEQYEKRVGKILKNSGWFERGKEKGKVKKAWLNARKQLGIEEPKPAPKKTAAKKSSSSKAKVSLEDITLTVVPGKHTKTGENIWTVTLTGGLLENADFAKLRAKAKENGGYYSSYRGNGAKPGFIFKTENQANYFAGVDAKEKSKAKERAKAIAIAMKIKYKYSK